jgi:organic radical activating enzyme
MYGTVYDINRERTKVPMEELLKTTPDTNHLIVITGGEPMLQQGALHYLCRRLWEDGYRVSIETAGTIAPRLEAWDVTAIDTNWTVSPKLENSGNELAKRYKPDVLRVFRDIGADFKFVVCEERDLEEIEYIQKEVEIPNDRMWLMAEGTSPDRREAERVVIDWVLARKWNLSSRKHIELWGDERGR